MKRWIPFVKSGPTVAVLRLTGMIAAGNRIGGGTLNDRGIGPLLDRAFTRGKPDAVALIVNSPGGSPVQSSLIGNRIRRLADAQDIPVHAFVEDLAASGGYWIAAAADRIWVDPTSIVGSIGVISASFGLHEFIERHGIERRVYTAGKSKSMLDPFKPENPEDVARVKAIQEEMHKVFIDHIRTRRGARLVDDERLFTGEVWVGEKSVEVGLADGVASLEPKMKEIFGDEVQFRAHTARRPLFQRFGAAAADGLIAGFEERGALARFGL